ncbi:MAG: glycosyltransferase family 9 protein [Candidatus Eisenbacteria bacterium]
MDLVGLYLKYQRDWVARRAPAPPMSIPKTLIGPRRLVACLGADPRLPPLVLPAMRLLRDRYENARLCVVTGADNTAALRRERIADKALVLQEKKGSGRVSEIRRLGKEVAKLEPDILFVFDGESDPRLLAVAHESKTPLRVGFGVGEHHPFLNFEVAPPRETTYLAQALLDLVGAVTGRFLDFLDDPVRGRVSEADAKRAERLVHFWQPRSERLLVAVEPGTEEGKEPDLAKFVAVARLLSKAFGARVMIVAGPERRGAAEELERRLAFLEPYRAQTDDLPQAVAFVSRADLMVSANTPLFHYAVTLGVPTLGLFSDDTPSWLIPSAGTAARILPIRKEITEDQFLKVVDELGAEVTGGGS